ncbi:helix-turn-helix domain-containing protein [Citromicrobium bathyomarinum]
MPKEGPPRFSRNDLDDEVGDRILRRRNELGFSRVELAKKSGIAPRTLARIERSAQYPTEKTLRRLAKALGTPLGALAPGWKSDDLEKLITGIEHTGIGLRKLRLERGLTQEDLAAAAGVSIGTISRFERGLHGEGALAFKQSSEDTSLTVRLILKSKELAERLGFPSPEALSQACEEVDLSEIE